MPSMVFSAAGETLAASSRRVMGSSFRKDVGAAAARDSSPRRPTEPRTCGCVCLVTPMACTSRVPPPMHSHSALDESCINTLRFLSVDAVEKANSGHPGLPMGAAPMAYVLWTRFLKHNPTNPSWIDRDRFVLSAGHGSMLLYSLLHLTGYDLPLEQIQLFRQWGSKTPGHPERGLTRGVETTTGPLGQGFANSVGMAIAEDYLAARYNRPDYQIVDHYTYALISDGDLME